MEADAAGNVTWEYRLEGSRFHHDFALLPNGNVLLLARRFKTRDEAVAAGADPAFVPPEGLRYEAIVEVRPTRPSGGIVVWEWSVWDHLIQDFDPDKDNYGDVAAHPELVDLNFLLENVFAASDPRRRGGWIHANAIDWHPGLDQIVITARHFSELWIIDHSTTAEEAAGHEGGDGGRGGDLLYRWGNPRAHRAGTAAGQQLFWPHHVHWIAPGLPVPATCSCSTTAWNSRAASAAGPPSSRSRRRRKAPATASPTRPPLSGRTRPILPPCSTRGS